MARISNKDKALAYATDKGIILTYRNPVATATPISHAAMPTVTGVAKLFAPVEPCTQQPD